MIITLLNVLKKNKLVIMDSSILLGILIALLQKDDILMGAVSILLCFCLILFNVNDHIYFYISILPFENSLKIFDINTFIFCFIISSIKLLFYLKLKIQVKCLLGLLMIIFVEIINDVFYAKIGTVLGSILVIIYTTLMVSSIKISQFSNMKIFYSQLLGIFTVVIYFIVINGGIISMLNNSLYNGIVFSRLGNDIDDAVATGGAMGIPLYSAMMISFILSGMLTGKIRVNKILGWFLGILVLIFGMLSISRSFLFCILSIMAVVFYTVAKTGKRKGILLIAFFSLLLLGWMNQEVVQNIYMVFDMRVIAETSFTGDRIDIWASAFKYLIDYPISIIYGNGVQYYRQLDNGTYLFNAGLHNLYFDTIFSLGIIGTLGLIIIIYAMWGNLKSKYGCVDNEYVSLPLVCLLTFGITALTLSGIKFWIYFIISMIWLFNKKGEEGEHAHT